MVTNLKVVTAADAVAVSPFKRTHGNQREQASKQASKRTSEKANTLGDGQIMSYFRVELVAWNEMKSKSYLEFLSHLVALLRFTCVHSFARNDVNTPHSPDSSMQPDEQPKMSEQQGN